MKIKHVYGNVLRLDIPLTIKKITIEDGVRIEREEDFYPDATKECTVELANNYNRKIQYDATVSGNVAHIEDDGVIGIGTYKVTVKCYDQYDNPYRYMVRDIVEICDATADAGIDAGVEFNAETYTLKGAVFVSYGGGGGVKQVQADWEEENETSKAFIKNKPEIPVVPTNVSAFNNDAGYLTQHQDISGKVDKVEGKGLSTNDYTDEEKEKLAGLENYDDTQVRQLINEEKTARQQSIENLDTNIAAEKTRAEGAESDLQEQITALSENDIIPVTSLPEIGEPNKIYRLAGTTSYTDYMFRPQDLTTPIPLATYDIAPLDAKVGYYECDSLGNSAAKTISADNYVLSTGGSMKVKMVNANTAYNATLNINNTWAKPLYYAGERASSNNSWEAGETVEVYYDGTNFYANNVAGGSGSGDGAFDVSTKYPTSGVEGGNTYTLEGALAVLNANLPVSKKKGGMSIKYIQSSDNKYVQYRLMANSFSTTESDWQGVDNEPTAGSDNLVKSGGVQHAVKNITIEDTILKETKSSDDFIQGEYYKRTGNIGSLAEASRIEIEITPRMHIVTTATTGEYDMWNCFMQGETVISYFHKLTTDEEELVIPEGATSLRMTNYKYDNPIVKIYEDIDVPVKQYIEEKDAEVLSESKAYTDTKCQETKDYTDTQIQETKEYAEQLVEDVKVNDSETSVFNDEDWEEDTYINNKGVKVNQNGFSSIEIPISKNTLAIELKNNEGGGLTTLFMKDNVVVEILPQGDGSVRQIDLTNALAAGANRFLASHWVASIAGKSEYLKVTTRIKVELNEFVNVRVEAGTQESKQYTDDKINNLPGLRKKINRYVNWVGTSIWHQDKSRGGIYAVDSGYQTLLKEQFDFLGDSGTTKSYSGYGICGDGNGNGSIAGQYLNTWTAHEGDIWTIDTNTNDHTWGAPMGTYADDFEGNTGPNTFYGALRMFRDKVLELSGPNAIVICSNQIQHGRGDYDYQNAKGYWTHDYEVAITEVAKNNGWYFVDQSPNCGFNKYTILHFSKDTQHPNDAGFRLIVKPWIEQFDIIYNKLLQEELNSQ